MQKKDLKQFKLPDTPGVYEFRDGEEVLYVGKATSLQDRVRSYFSKDLTDTRGPRIVQMIDRANDLTWHETDSVLEALILEANLIKKLQPPYNVREKDGKSFNHVVITDEAFPRVFLERGRNLRNQADLSYDIKYIFGPFPNGGALREALKIVRRIFPFRDRKASDATHERFYQQLDLTPDTKSEEARDAYQKTIQNIRRIFQGQKKTVLGELDREMHRLARDQKFEQADRVKKQIFALQHIRDVSLIKADRIEAARGVSFRIEAYDIAHISGAYMVGVMTVVEDGLVDKTEYRTFKIKTVKGPDDTAALAEVLERRFRHPEWTFPQLVVVDGGVAQYNVGRKVLDSLDLDIPVVAVTKDERHRPRDIKGAGALIRSYQKEIILANSEAHRFAVSFHDQQRRRQMRGK